jgi:protein TonB
VTTRIPNSGDSFVKPKRLSRTPVAYPSSLKARRIEGDVVLLIDIASTGTVGKVMVLRSSGYQELDDAARKAAIKERFAPAKRNGTPVDYTLKYTYRFRIKDA